MYMDDIKLSAKDKKELETLKQTMGTYIQVIGIEFRIEKCDILIMKSGKRESAKKRKPTKNNRTTKSRKH